MGAKAKRDLRMSAVGLGGTEKSGEQMLRLLSHCTNPILLAEEEKRLVLNWETGEGKVKLDRRNEQMVLDIRGMLCSKASFGSQQSGLAKNYLPMQICKMYSCWKGQCVSNGKEMEEEKLLYL